ncbi:hypothetical protein UA24_13965 [Marinomonas sp. BSi20414]|nr:hypothetical protein [Marinomonas sp. BSi20414]
MGVMTVVALTTMGYFSLGVVGCCDFARLLNDYLAYSWLGSCSIYLFLKQAPLGIFLDSLLLNIAKPISQDKLIMILTKWLP